MKEMKALLTAIQAELQSGLKYIRPGDIFISPHVDYIPTAAKMPCIGIKDGPIARKELAGGEMEYAMGVHIVIFAQNPKGIQYVIMGDDPSNQNGILDIEEEVHVILDENLLDIDLMESAFCNTSAESEVLGRGNDLIQQKVMKF